MNKTFIIHSFGCKVNQEEGLELAALFTAQGWREAAPQDVADLYIINTCTVTQIADKKARALIRRWRRDYPQALLAVTGCYAQTSPQQIAALAGVDIIAGLAERARLPQLAEQRLLQGQALRNQALREVADIATAAAFTPIGPAARQKRARAYVKIEDGCEALCHYCIVPYARGPIRSLPLAAALAGARELLAAGHQELVLSGIHIGAYGLDLPPGENLCALIESILALGGEFRLRLGSLEPRHFSAELLRLLQQEARICPHLHIPLQSGCDRTLAAMNRTYTTADYAALLAQLRELRPRLAITTDVMAGYPGETAEDFQASLDFCAAMGFAKMHVFPYSRRAGTVAATLPQQIPHKEKTSRAALMGALAEQLAGSYASAFIGARLQYLHEQEILLDGQLYYSGHSGNYLPLALPATKAPPSGLVMVQAVEYRGGYLLCEDMEQGSQN